jgi:hypothetical protein
MIGLMVLKMLVHLSPGRNTVALIGWSIVTVVGMGVWVWPNWQSLQQEQREQQARRRQPALPGPRTIPLTPTQRRFLDVMYKK